MKLDDMVRKFREYAEGKNGYDELDFKADLLAWHREEVALARADEIDQIISDGIFPEKYLLDRAEAHRKQATNKTKEVEDER